MGSVFLQGQALGSTDLRIEFTGNSGEPIEPEWVFYNLYDLSVPDAAIRQRFFGPVRVGSSDQLPIRLGTGVYYVDWIVPLGENFGMHKVVWTYKDSETGRVMDVEKEFSVIGLDPRFAFTNISVPPAPVTPQSPQPPGELFFIYKGTSKTLTVTFLDDFGSQVDLTDTTSIFIRISTSPVILERSMALYGSPSTGKVYYMFLPADTLSVSEGTYQAQVTAEFSDGRVIKTDIFYIQIAASV